jgi:hypothetical protein
MQTSIDRRRRMTKRRGSQLLPSVHELTRKTAWLAWPLIHWRGCASKPRNLPDGVSLPSLHSAIVDQLQSSPPGLYALEPPTGSSAQIRLRAIKGCLLGTTTHAVAQIERSIEAEGVSPASAALGANRRSFEIRLHVLSKCMHALEENPKAVPRILRQHFWEIDSTDIVPPSTISERLQRCCDLSSRAIRHAALEYGLRSMHPDFPRFLRALQGLADVATLIDSEPQRRRGLYLSLIKQANQLQPAYEPIEVSAGSDRTAITWKPNPEFCRAVVSIFLDRTLPPELARGIADSSMANLTIEDLSAWIVGTRLTPFKRRPVKSWERFPNLADRLLTAMGAQPTPADAEWKITLCTLVARIAVINADPETPSRLISWINACREWRPFSSTNTGTWCSIVISLQSWLIASEFKPDNLRRLVGILENRPIGVLVEGWITHREPCASHWLLAQLGSLDAGQSLAVIDHRLATIHHEWFSGKPEQFKILINFVSLDYRRWNQLEQGQRRKWFRLLSNLRNSTLLARVVQWCSSLICSRGFTLNDVSAFIPTVHQFATADRTRAEQANRESFLLNHLWLLDAVLEETESSLRTLVKDEFDDWSSHSVFWNRRKGIIEIYYHWLCAGFANANAMVKVVYDRCRKFDSKRIETGDRYRYPSSLLSRVEGFESLVVWMSDGSINRLLVLMKGLAYLDSDISELLPFLKRYPSLRETLYQALCVRNGNTTIQKWLDGMALALRLQMRDALRLGLEKWVEAISVEPLESLRRLRLIAGSANDLPSSVAKILARDEQLHSEHASLSVQQIAGTISESAARRLAKLTQLLAEPERVAAWTRRDLQHQVRKFLPTARMNALTAIVNRATQTHWQRLIPCHASTPDWENARRLYYSTEKNRTVLRRLLHHTVRQDDDWRLRHGPNAKFAAELAANRLSIERWLAPYQRTFLVRGQPWTIHLERDPLRVLQMGNLFGTCLSVDGGNAFSTIANAVECNKQVLYLNDSHGVIIGRKLIGLTVDGHLFGFHSYGASCLVELERPESPRVWIKIAFDLACLELMRRTGAQFDQSTDATQAAEKLNLSAAWYNDGPEPFDWWIQPTDLADAVLQGLRREVAEIVEAWIHKRGLDFKSADQRALESLRALLWLGEEGASLLQRLPQGMAAEQCTAFLRAQMGTATLWGPTSQAI